MRTLRLVAVVLAAALLAACASTIAPSGARLGEPELSQTTFLTVDGLSLPVRRWLPDGEPKAVVLALHGFNDYSKAFDNIPEGALGTGPFLASQGYAVYAYDQRGFGASAHRGLWPGRDALVGDARDFAGVLRRKHPGLKVYGLGESMGGAVLMVAAAQTQQQPFDGLMLAAPAVWARSTMPAPYRAALWLASRVAPGFKASGRGLGRLASDNIALLRHNARDPLFIKDTRVDAVAGLSDLMDEALTSAPKIDVQTLYLYGHNDQVIPKAPTLAAVRTMSADNLSFAYYPSGWHIVLRDKAASTVLADVGAFLANPGCALPSGADHDALARLAMRPKARR